MSLNNESKIINLAITKNKGFSLLNLLEDINSFDIKPSVSPCHLITRTSVSNVEIRFLKKCSSLYSTESASTIVDKTSRSQVIISFKKNDDLILPKNKSQLGQNYNVYYVEPLRNGIYQNDFFKKSKISNSTLNTRNKCVYKPSSTKGIYHENNKNKAKISAPFLLEINNAEVEHDLNSNNIQAETKDNVSSDAIHAELNSHCSSPKQCNECNSKAYTNQPLSFFKNLLSILQSKIGFRSREIPSFELKDYPDCAANIKYEKNVKPLSKYPQQKCNVFNKKSQCNCIRVTDKNTNFIGETCKEKYTNLKEIFTQRTQSNEANNQFFKSPSFCTILTKKEDNGTNTNIRKEYSSQSNQVYSRFNQIRSCSCSYSEKEHSSYKNKSASKSQSRKCCPQFSDAFMNNLVPKICVRAEKNLKRACKRKRNVKPHRTNTQACFNHLPSHSVCCQPPAHVVYKRFHDHLPCRQLPTYPQTRDYPRFFNYTPKHFPQKYTKSNYTYPSTSRPLSKNCQKESEINVSKSFPPTKKQCKQCTDLKQSINSIVQKLHYIATNTESIGYPSQYIPNVIYDKINKNKPYKIQNDLKPHNFSQQYDTDLKIACICNEQVLQVVPLNIKPNCDSCNSCYSQFKCTPAVQTPNFRKQLQNDNNSS